MNLLKTVTKYESVSGILEWEIEDVSSHFKKCDSCWNGTDHQRYNCSPSDSVQLSSAKMQLTAGGGKQSTWHFQLYRNTGRQSKGFEIWLYFDGLFDSDGSEVSGPLLFKYNLSIEISLVDKVEILNTVEGKESIDPKIPKSIYCQQVPFLQLKSVWPNGNLRISAEITHLSNITNEVFNNGQFLDLLDLKDALPVPVPSCYGNLLNNPDMSDFKITCQGSTFQAHKLILSVRSRVFRVMIESGLSESIQHETKIQDMTAKTVESMLEFIYKGTLEIFPEDLKEKIELLDCAEKYELDGLKSICMRKIFSSLPTVKEVGELAMAAFTYGANDRASKVIKDFCTMNFAKLVQDPEYKKLFLANPQAFMN